MTQEKGDKGPVQKQDQPDHNGWTTKRKEAISGACFTAQHQRCPGRWLLKSGTVVCPCGCHQ